MNRDRGGGTLLVAAAALLAAAPLLPGLIAGRSLYYRDVGQYYVPNRWLTMETLGAGRLPLWNPLRGEGQPFLANPNSFVLRPTTLLFLPFPPAMVHVPMTLSVMSLLALAGAGTFVLLRDLGRSAEASLIGAAAFSLSGAVQSMGQLLNHLEGVAWIPLTLLCAHRALRRGWRPWGILCGLSLAMIVTAGEPVWIAVTALAALALPSIRGAPAGRVAAAAGAALLVGLLACAFQVAPLLDNVARSERGAGLAGEEVMKWSLPPAALLQTAIPSLWGDPARSSPLAYWGSGMFDTSLPWLLSIHVGAPILFLAFARGGGAAPISLAILSALLALGRFTPVYPFLARVVPGGGSVRYPVKWIVLGVWCCSLLAAAGFDRWRDARPGGGRDGGSRAAAIAVSIAFVLAGLLLWSGAVPGAAAAVRILVGAPAPLGETILQAGAVRTIGRSMALAAAALAALLVLMRPSASRTPARTWGAAALCVLVCLWGAATLHPSAPPSVVFARSPLVDRIPEAAAGRARFFGYPRPPGFAYRTPAPDEAAAAGLTADSLAWGVRWDARTLRNGTFFRDGVHGAYDRFGDSRLDLLPGSEVARRLGEGLAPEVAARFFSAASVRYILAYGSDPGLPFPGTPVLEGESNVPMSLHENVAALPRAYLVASAEETSAPEALDRIAGGKIDLARTVLLEVGRSGPAGTAGAAGAADLQAGETASIVLDEPGETIVRVSARDERWLVLTDTFDASWRAAVDGAPAAIARANAMFRAVKIGAGDHEVRFTYAPRSFVLGCGVSLAALAASVIVAAWPSRARPAA